MLLVISPAKTLDFETLSHTQLFSQGDFLPQAQKLIDVLAPMPPQDIALLMKLSDKLAALNTARYGSWHTPFTMDNAKQAILAFKGDVYTGLEAHTLTDAQLEFSQSHMRILSGLYGLLRPLDLMQAYRLEMGTKLDNPKGKDLYTYWGSTITDGLNELLDQEITPILVNLASNEYFKAVKTKQLAGRIITPVFKDRKNGIYKIISFFAKKARGMMARYIIENELTDVEGLKAFNTSGYYYSKEQSTENQWVFLREEV
ncbi:MAG: peroxide stress protein YaaA [Pseudomonadales bacterium]